MEDKKPTVDRTENNNAETETPKLDLKDQAAENAEAETAETAETAEKAERTEKAEQAEKTATAGKKPRFSGAYWFTDKSAEELQKQSAIRTMLTVIATLLQLVVLVLPQNGIGYITEKLPSYAFAYMCAVFVMLFTAVFVIIMNFYRYKLRKRIPKEYAPRRGFKRRSFFGAEALVATTAILTIMEISFVCLSYDGFGLLGVFLCALSTAAAVWARMTTVFVLKDAAYAPAIGETVEAKPDEPKKEDKAEK